MLEVEKENINFKLYSVNVSVSSKAWNNLHKSVDSSRVSLLNINREFDKKMEYDCMFRFEILKILVNK